MKNLWLSVSLLVSVPVWANSSDFFISVSSLKPLSTSPVEVQETDCRARIESLMCLVEEEWKKGVQRSCLPGGESYAVHFETLYDHYPEVLQKVFCSLDAIYIEKNFYGTAYAGTSSEDGTTAMGIRQSVLDEGLDLKTWASWKEQTSFGGKLDTFVVNSGLPHVETSQSTGVNDFLYFVIAHEFGHILDFANKVNETECPGDPTTECAMKVGTWGSMGWLTDKTPKSENDFSNRTGICFYWCEGNSLAVDVVSQIYEDLSKTSFISTYATTQPWDDFADSLAYFLVHRNLKSSYVLDTGQGTQYDIMEKLASPLFKDKYEYLDKFVQRKDLIYP